jgi:hypothetical protein
LRSKTFVTCNSGKKGDWRPGKKKNGNVSEDGGSSGNLRRLRFRLLHNKLACEQARPLTVNNVMVMQSDDRQSRSHPVGNDRAMDLPEKTNLAGERQHSFDAGIR